MTNLGARAPSLSLLALQLISFIAGPWSLFQWMELVIALDGGPVSCSINESLDCSKVWMAPLAKSIHDLSGLPLAGWGLVWAFVAFVAPLRLMVDQFAGRPLTTAVLGIRSVALGGIIASVALFFLSVSTGALCPTCLATYALVFAYAGVAIFGLRIQGPKPDPIGSLLPIVASVALGWIVLLYPGLLTPREPTIAVHEKNGGGTLSELVKRLPPQGQLALAQAVKSLRSPAKNEDIQPRRLLKSSSDPVLLTDFSDLKCVHCRSLVLAVEAMRQDLGVAFAEDSRYFPLSSNCNPEVPASLRDATGTRCLAARVLLCLENDQGYKKLRTRLFEAQTELDPDLVIEIAREVTGKNEADLRACAQSAEVDQKLRDDIAYAMRYNLQGTPMVLINGRTIPAHPLIVQAVLLAGGNPNHPAFSNLPDLQER